MLGTGTTQPDIHMKISDVYAWLNLLLQGRLGLSKVADCPGVNAIFGCFLLSHLLTMSSSIQIEIRAGICDAEMFDVDSAQFPLKAAA